MTIAEARLLVIGLVEADRWPAFRDYGRSGKKAKSLDDNPLGVLDSIADVDAG